MPFHRGTMSFSSHSADGKCASAHGWGANELANITLQLRAMHLMFTSRLVICHLSCFLLCCYTTHPSTPANKMIHVLAWVMIFCWFSCDLWGREQPTSEQPLTYCRQLLPSWGKKYKVDLCETIAQKLGVEIPVGGHWPSVPPCLVIRTVKSEYRVPCSLSQSAHDIWTGLSYITVGWWGP